MVIEAEKFVPLAERLKIAAEDVGGECTNISTDTEDLEVLRGAQIVEIEVKDIEKWQSPEAGEKLLDFFGEAVHRIYGPRDRIVPFNPENPEMHSKAMKSIYDGDIGIAQKIQVLIENEKVVSFVAGEHEEMETPQGKEKVFYLSLIYTDPEQRNRGIGKEMLRTMLSESDADSFLAISSTPAAVKLSIEELNRAGFTGFFCGIPQGDIDRKISQEDVARSDALIDDLTESCDQDGLLSDTGKEQGYLVFKHEIGPIPPLKRKEVKFDDNPELQRLFNDKLLKLQDRCGEDTVYGIISGVR